MTCGGILGWVACALVFITFLAHEMRVLRTLAILSNIAFIAYGGLDHLWPIVALHIAMMPVNIVRLSQTFATTQRGDFASIVSDRSSASVPNIG